MHLVCPKNVLQTARQLLLASPTIKLEDFYKVIYYYEKKVVWLDLMV
jgi:hypothetical protein